eukprot:gb/GFBE01044338.1/.p1 GENE.gb/GFBE01044338.1/~~gb/GFBE01044338.1/.p1  ORF type:complete len:420 (+),score=79.46 gb/GFBE01044338.1/:1-1260(+)
MEDTPSPAAYCWAKDSPSPSKGSAGDRMIPNRKALLDFNSYMPDEPAKEDLLKSELFPHTRRSLFSYKDELENADGSGSVFSLSLLRAAPKCRPEPRRSISKIPFSVLDAPGLTDDYYLNLLDWSSADLLAVGLADNPFVYNVHTKKVSKLTGQGVPVTAVSWAVSGTHLASGNKEGLVEIHDAATQKVLRKMEGHRGRVGCLAWNGYVLSTGSRDKTIMQRDVRVPLSCVARLNGHSEEVCGLKWSGDGQQLASGGNDNRLCVWSLASSRPQFETQEHKAAVKALAWSPHKRGLLASGGGTADQTIRFWDTSRGSMRALSCHSTGSQVCNVVWSRSTNELLSTHGYSLNQMHVWSYPSMTKLETLTGHTYRVVHMALSPDGQTVVTGAGDETVRFWKVFPGAKRSASPGSSALQQVIR